MNQIAEPFSWPDIEPLMDELKRVARYALRSSSAESLATSDLLDTALRRMFQREGEWDYDRLWVNRAQVFGAFRTAVRNALIDHHRKQWTEKRAPGAKRLSFEDLAEPPERILHDPDLFFDLMTCMQKVAAGDDANLAVLEWKLIWDHTADEIAAILDVPRSTIRDRLGRLLAEMQTCLAP